MLPYQHWQKMEAVCLHALTSVIRQDLLLITIFWRHNQLFYQCCHHLISISCPWPFYVVKKTDRYPKEEAINYKPQYLSVVLETKQVRKSNITTHLWKFYYCLNLKIIFKKGFSNQYKKVPLLWYNRVLLPGNYSKCTTWYIIIIVHINPCSITLSSCIHLGSPAENSPNATCFIRLKMHYYNWRFLQ